MLLQATKTFFVLTCLAIAYVIWLVFSHETKTANPFSCYFERGDEIPYLSDWIKPPANSIYFVETSCSGALDSRQACAVEAAARSQTNTTTIYVLFLAPVRNNDTKTFKTLQQFKQVKIRRIDIFDMSLFTPLEFLADSGALAKSKYWVHHASDLARYLIMYKWGGVYLDLDTVVVKNLSALGRNWVARESEETVAAGAMAFSRDHVGRMFADAAIRDLAKNFRGDSWGDNGPGVITRVLRDKCKEQELYYMDAYKCQGFEVYDKQLFYPIPFAEAYTYFKPRNISDSPYMYHVWNYLTHKTRVHNSSLYAALARRHCPSVYEAYGHRFGS